MTILYRRLIRVEIAGVVAEDLRIVAEVQRQINQTQAKGRVDIYNLSPAREEQIFKRGGPIVVSAGYPDTQAQIFDGAAQRITRVRDALARITRIHLGDEVRQVERLGGITVRAYDGPVSVRTIAADLAVDMELPLGPVDLIPAGATALNWYYPGAASVALTELLSHVECEWFEVDGVIRINKIGKTQSDTACIAVSQATGMVRSPIVTDEGAEVTMLLNPAVVLGCKIQLKSEVLGGNWKVVGLHHTADNWRTGKFVTWADLRTLDPP